jgi:hypothetical protein
VGSELFLGRGIPCELRVCKRTYGITNDQFPAVKILGTGVCLVLANSNTDITLTASGLASVLEIGKNGRSICRVIQPVTFSPGRPSETLIVDLVSESRSGVRVGV